MAKLTIITENYTRATYFVKLLIIIIYMDYIFSGNLEIILSDLPNVKSEPNLKYKSIKLDLYKWIRAKNELKNCKPLNKNNKIKQNKIKEKDIIKEKDKKIEDLQEKCEELQKQLKIKNEFILQKV